MSRAFPSPDATDSFLTHSVTAVRWLLGIQCLLSGLNWWFKILPFPNMFDPPGMPVKAEIVRTMIDSGWMFTAAKLVEVALGIALLTNRFVPLMLVVAFPVLLMTFMMDALIGDTVLAWFQGNVPFQHLWAELLDMIFFGGAVIVMQLFLMLSYFDHYRSMLTFRARAVDWSAL